MGNACNQYHYGTFYDKDGRTVQIQGLLEGSLRDESASANSVSYSLNVSVLRKGKGRISLGTPNA